MFNFVLRPSCSCSDSFRKLIEKKMNRLVLKKVSTLYRIKTKKIDYLTIYVLVSVRNM